MRGQLIQRIPYGFLFMGVALAVAACFNEPDFSETPELDSPASALKYFQPGDGRFQADRDSVVIAVNFRDKSGDLGEETTDSTYLANKFGRETWGNYELRTFRLINGRFQEFTGEQIKLFFPPLVRSGRRGAIEGTLEFRQLFFYTRPFRLYPTKFQVRIRDRAMNVSNVVETDTVSVPYLER